jgi:hypothetical protein
VPANLFGTLFENQVKVSTTKVRRCLAAAFLTLGAAGGASADRESAAFFEDIRRTYSQRLSYSDVGQIEIVEEVGGVVSSRLHFFETAATREAGLVWRVMMDSGQGFENHAVWLTGGTVMVHNESLGLASPARSIADAIEQVLGPEVRQGLLVPVLLQLGTDPEDALAPLAAPAAMSTTAETATLGTAQPCLGERQCRLLTTTLAGGAEIRLMVEIDTFWVHDVEVVVQETAGNAPKTTTIRVSHSASALEEGILQTKVSSSPFAPPPREEPLLPEAGFYDQITVDVFTVLARIVTHSGFPLRSLEPRDLLVTVGDQELPVTALDWYGAAEPMADTPAEPEPAKHPMKTLEPVETGPARLVVIFLQNDFEPTRALGHMKLFPGLRKMVDGLGSSDRVALLSFFGHLKLWQDFTTDREAVKASLDRAFYPGAKPDHVEPSPGLSLLDSFDVDAARKVANSMDAMRFTANALAPLPGAKDIIFFGYGLEGAPEAPMLGALRAARASTFVIDTTQADFHTLGATLETMARATGGTYESSYLFPGQALNKTERTMTGHYIITIDRSAIPDARGALTIQLRDKKGKVLMVPSDLR